MIDVLLSFVVAFSLVLLIAAWIFGMIVITAIILGIINR